MVAKSRECTICRVPMWDGYVSALPVCRSCRRAHPLLGPSRPPAPRILKCQRCGDEFEAGSHRDRKFCSRKCSGSRHGLDRRANRKVVRDDRERSAPGLNRAERRRLLKRWIVQGRACVYCQAPASTIDHVIPLVRGGDSFEGNLAPACLPCNSAKCDRLVVEWRTGRRMATYVRRSRPAARRKPQRRAIQGVQEALYICAICQELYPGPARATCGDWHCQREHAGRQSRDRYRIDHGLAVDPSEPTLYWIRLRGLPLSSRVRARAA